MPVVYDIKCAATLYHMHVSSSKNCNLLSNRYRLPRLLQKLARGGFSTCWIQLCYPGIQASIGILWEPLLAANEILLGDFLFRNSENLCQLSVSLGLIPPKLFAEFPYPYLYLCMTQIHCAAFLFPRLPTCFGLLFVTNNTVCRPKTE